jgi:hypothetical protein
MKRLALIVILVSAAGACDGGDGSPATVFVCPSYEVGAGSDELILTPLALGTPVERSEPPELYAEVGDEAVQLNPGPSDWCGVHSDQFDVVTSGAPLPASLNEEVTIENPLADEPQFATAIIQGPFVEPASGEGDRRVWQGAGWTARFRNEMDEAGRLAFAAPGEPGDYVVIVFLQYGFTEDMFETSDREGHWALHLQVTD